MCDGGLTCSANEALDVAGLQFLGLDDLSGAEFDPVICLPREAKCLYGGSKGLDHSFILYIGPPLAVVAPNQSLAYRLRW